MANKALGLVLAVLLAAGCSTIPDGGEVTIVGDVRPADDGSEPGRDPVRRFPSGPPAGATPEQVVRGYLDAQADPANGHAIARLFLGPDVEWRDTGPITVYDTRAFTVQTPARDRAVVTVRTRRSAMVSPRGEYRSVTPGVEVAEPFVLLRRSGEWRLSAVPGGLRLS